MGAISNEVIAPDMVGSLRPQPDARSVVEPETPAFGLFGRYFEPLASPYPFDTILVHRPAPLIVSSMVKPYFREDHFKGGRSITWRALSADFWA